MSDLPFETLIKANNYRRAADRWYPRAAETYQNAFKLDNSVENSGALRKNLSYSMQYLEFLEKEMAELNVSDVIYTMLVKTYVITGMSVLEGLFTNIIRTNGWWKTSSLDSLGTTKANETKFGEDKYVVRTEILKKVPDYNLRMDLDGMITVLDNHHKALKVDHLVYPALQRLRKLRNRVHLQISESNTDHDYNVFDFRVKYEMKSILYEILTSEMITDTPHIFEFLKEEV